MERKEDTLELHTDSTVDLPSSSTSITHTKRTHSDANPTPSSPSPSPKATSDSDSDLSSSSSSEEEDEQVKKKAKTEQATDMSSTTGHAEPEGDCIFCCDDFSKENYVEYQDRENGPWMKSVYCQGCIQSAFIDAQWGKYLENIAKADCAAALRRVLSAPPQINVKDAGLPCENSTGEVHQFWFASDNEVHSAKLKDSLVGAERDAFWSEKQAFLTATELQEELAKAEAAKEAK